MPGSSNIEQYENGIDGLAPQSRGSEAFAQEGRRVGSFYHQIGQDIGGDVKTLGDAFIEHQTNLELANGVKSATDMELQLEVSRPQFFKDNPGPDGAAKWQQHVQEVTGQWSSHFQTERGKTWSAEEGARIYGQSVRKGIADQAEVDLASTLEARQGSANNLLAMSRIDPSSTDHVLDQLEHNDSQFQPALMDPGEWAKNHAEFVSTMKRGAALNHYLGTADAAMQQFRAGAQTSAAYDQGVRELDSGKYADLLGEEGVQRAKAALEEGRRSGQEQFRVNQEATVKDSVLAGDNDFLGLYHSLNSKTLNGEPLSPEDNDAIVKYENAHPHNTTQSMELERFRTTAAKDQLHETFVHSDGDLLNDMWRRASLPPGDPGALKPTEVSAAIHDRKLNPADGNLLLKDVAEGRKGGTGGNADMKRYQTQLMQWAASTIKPSLMHGQDASGLGGGGPDPAGGMAWGEAMREVVATYKSWAATEGPAKAFDIMTNPGNNRNIMQRLPYWQAAASSGQPEDFFGANPNPDAWVNIRRGLAPDGRVPGQAGPPGQPPAGAGSVAPAMKAQPGESPDAYLKRRGF